MDGMNMRPPQPTLEQVAQTELQMLNLREQVEEERLAQPPKITSDVVRKATEILRKYKAGKAHLEKKIIDDEEYWKLRQWDKNYKKGEDYKPATAWLWSCIQGRHSDAMDSKPAPNILARQRDDKEEAKQLSAILPVILEQNRYEETYSDVVWYMLKHGGCVQGIFWDKSKHNGLGDIEIKQIDYLNLFWESGIKDIQDSDNLFYVELIDKKLLESQYPEQTAGKLKGDDIGIAKYHYDDQVDTSDKALVIDWYYHKFVNGKKTLQYVKYVNDIVLYATENDTKRPTRTTVDPDTNIPVVTETGEPSMAERGLYDHGLYPFVVQQLYPIEGSLCGYGLTDIGKDCQMQIDVLNKAITESAVTNAAPQVIARRNSGINMDEFLDVNKPVKYVDGNISDSVMPLSMQQLGSVYVDVMQSKIEELKYITSNQDVGNGLAPSGITAASAIAALQETQGKNARETNATLYRSFRDVVYIMIELIRQFYTLPRVFRIAPDTLENNEEEFITYTNAGIVPQHQIQAITGRDLGMRTPEFDIEVSAEKQNPYRKMEQNELALSFFNRGFFNPQLSDQALGCLQMMDFPHKEDVMARIRQNGTIQEMLLQYQQIALRLAQAVANLTKKPVDQAFADQIAQGILQDNQAVMPKQTASEPMENMGRTEESAHMTKARNQARESTVIE